eukprot:gene13550-13669_t
MSRPVILEGLEWLGLPHHGQTVFQSTRQARHAEVAWQMLEAGRAYRCYLSPAELTAMREQAAAEKRPFRLVSPWRDRDPAEAPSDIKPVIRLRAPQDGETVVDDMVQGQVRVANTELDDMIILRSDAVCNYLLRLGWGHGDTELIGMDEAIKLFTLEAVGRAASRMDYAKLTHVNAHYMRLADDTRLTGEVASRLNVTDPTVMARIKTLMPGLKERARTLIELAQSAAFLTLSLPIAFDAKAQALLTEESRAMLAEIATALEASDFTQPAIDAILRETAERTGRKLGQVAQPIRAALTGTTTSPPIDATLLALGREESLARIRAACA